MNLTFDIIDLEKKCEEHYDYRRVDSLTHDFLHIKNVANGTVFFVKVLGGTEREQQLGYVAGLLHDYTRLRAKGDSHTKTGAEKSREILNGYNSFDKNEIDEIYQAIYDHSGPVDWKSKVSEGLFLSDKIFEHMGAYVAFRAPLWICETGDRYPGLTRTERFLSYYERAKSKKLLENYYPEYTQKLVDYQLKWNNDFVSSLTKREEWSDDIIKNMFDVIKNGDNPERAIRSFKPKNNMQELWLKETLDYIDGKKYEEFEKMIP